MPTHWIIKRDVPILDEHTLTDQDGKEVVRIDAARLRDIAGKATRRVRDTGDLVPIVIGHTTDDGPEDTQPEIVGFAGPPFKVVPFRRTGRKVLTATFRFFKHMKDKVSKYPRRSVELWLSDWKIDPIALLGATTPERDLGLLQLERGGRRFYRRVLGGGASVNDEYDGPGPVDHEDTSGPDDELVRKVIAALQQTDCWQFLEQLKQEAEAEPEMPEEGAPGIMPPAGPEGVPPPLPPGGPGGVEDEYPEDEDQPVKYENSMPGGTNTSTPGGTGRASRRPAKAPRVGPGPRPIQHSRQPRQGRQDTRPAYPAHQPQVEEDYLDYPDRDQERVRLVRDQTQGQLARYQRALQSQQAQLQDLRLRYQRAEREKDLIQLESEGYLLDRAEELSLVEGMPEAHYKRHLGQVRKRYQRAPVGGPSYSQEDLRAGNGLAGRSRDQAQSAVALAQRKGISYEEALAQLTGDPVF